MKLCTFETRDGSTGVGLVLADGILNIAAHLPAAPRDMPGLIGQWADWREALQDLHDTRRADLALDQVTLLAPVPRPGKILAIGDSVRTDAIGAANAGLDLLFITGSIHAEELDAFGSPDPAAVEALVAPSGARLVGAMPRLAW